MTPMKVSAVLALVLALSGSAQAATYTLQSNKASSAPSVERMEASAARGERVVQVQFNLKQLETTDASIGSESFQKLAVDDVSLTSEIGAPELPFYAVTVAAAPQDIVVEANLGEAAAIDGVRAYPAQAEKCRCADDLRSTPVYDARAYRAPDTTHRIEVLGDFRGTPVSRVIVFPQRYDAGARKLVVHPRASFKIRIKGSREQTDMNELLAQAAKGKGKGAYDYLVIAPSYFLSAVEEWIEFKKTTRGFRFKVLSLEEAGNSASLLSQRIHSEYEESKFLYALIIGNQMRVPAHRVQTSGSSQTPSDLPYFAMGGSDDTIPDVFAGRLVVQTEEEARRQLSKFMAYEQDQNAPAGWTRALGVASNEGANPSDNEYVLSIENKLTEKFGTEINHFYQNDSASTPANFNQAMNQGSMWMTYMGHGSGYSWPSFGREYRISDIKYMQNANAVKPIWIDVACQNGRLEPNMGGERMMNETDAQGRAIGTTAFYGGTVNISWHPPAILARGIIFKMVENDNLRVLGPLLQAGHVYLSENYSNSSELKYNQRWYVLQGDPSMEVRYTP